MHIVTLTDVKKHYMLGKVVVEAIRGVTFNIKKGDFISIVGPSGSGKTTILNMLGCIDTPTEGSIKILDLDVNDLNDRSLTALRHEVIGFIFQSFNLIPVLDIYENVEFPLLVGTGHSVFSSDSGQKKSRVMGKKEKEEWIDYLLNAVGLSGWKNHKPNELSGGQRQRAAIARALVTRPQIVLADEPTANLDSRTGENIITLMKQINREQNTTFIFSTHDSAIVSIADHIVRLKDGLIHSEEGGAP